MRRRSLLLIHPQNRIHRYASGVYPKALRYAPLTLPTLVALIPPGLPFDIIAVDEMVAAVPLDARPDLVAITCITGTASRAYQLADHYRSFGARVILGGVHPTLMTVEALEHADAVVRGYAETAWPQALSDYLAGRLQRIYEGTPAGAPSGIVSPQRSVISRKGYAGSNTVELGRGCVNRCAFCSSSTFTPAYVRRNIGDVLDEIRVMRGRIVYFLDPDLVCDPEFALEFFTELRRFRKWWVGCASFSLFDHPALLDAITASGCHGLLVGFESLNNECLRSARKTQNLGRDYRAHIRELHQRGILVNATFVFGFDADTPPVFDETVDFVIENRIDIPQFTILTPFPGTPLFARLDRERRILTRDWSLYNGQNVVFQPQSMTAESLGLGTHRARMRAYSASAIARRMLGRPWWLKPAALWANIQFHRYAASLGPAYAGRERIPAIPDYA